MFPNCILVEDSCEGCSDGNAYLRAQNTKSIQFPGRVEIANAVSQQLLLNSS
jgi:hypothetical protein